MGKITELLPPEPVYGGPTVQVYHQSPQFAGHYSPIPQPPAPPPHPSHQAVTSPSTSIPPPDYPQKSASTHPKSTSTCSRPPRQLQQARNLLRALIPLTQKSAFGLLRKAGRASALPLFHPRFSLQNSQKKHQNTPKIPKKQPKTPQKLPKNNPNKPKNDPFSNKIPPFSPKKR